ncbi:MAG: cupredoxin domain-containing protein [Candidatus Micrarchaeota archaeon]|nr:cupredoxin domain-containing protein [Candidatus Micrarchaeota archaeon]
MKLFVLFLFAGLLLFGCAAPENSAPTATAAASVQTTATATAVPSAASVSASVIPATISGEPTATPTIEPTAQPSASVSVQEFTVTAKQFEFSPATLTVKKGVPVKLAITSQDVEHSFSLPEFNVNQKLPPGETKTVEFTPDKTGEFTFFCSVFCGAGHGSMRGKLVVTE